MALYFLNGFFGLTAETLGMDFSLRHFVYAEQIGIVLEQFISEHHLRFEVRERTLGEPEARVNVLTRR